MARLTPHAAARPRLGSRGRTVTHFIDAFFADGSRVLTFDSFQHRVQAADRSVQTVNRARRAMPSGDAWSGTMLQANLFDAELVEAIKPEVRCFVSQLQETV